MTALLDKLRLYDNTFDDPIYAEAADEIERLRAAMKYTGTELGKAREEIERLRDALELIRADKPFPRRIAHEALDDADV